MWYSRLQNLHANWASLIPFLVDAYLTWKDSAKASCAAEYDFTIHTVDIFTLERSALISRSADCHSPSIALILQGYMGNTPHSPSYAVSLQTLEHHHLLHLRKPSLSVEAFAKVICDSYGIPYVRTYRTVLSSTFDIYITILCEVEKHIKAALQRDLPNWRVLNACPACTYMLEDEPLLKFNHMYVFDEGGNSAKRMLTLAEQQTGDLRCFGDSDYLLPRTFVDTFTGEVQPKSSIPDEDSAPGIDDRLPVSNDASDSIAADCSKNWKAAASDEKKRMWSIFDETGIFISACHHGLILWYADMVQSRELAKYPLAIIAKVLELLGECSLGAYDIGCGFSSMVMASSLGPLFKNMDCCLCVDAFHGFAHNYCCQTKHHPLGIDGAGLEDFGTIEHIFSASNALSPVIQYASAYNRHIFLDMFFKQWDDEKYANLAMMIYNNYCQALQIISKELVALTEAMASLGITEEDFNLWHQEEVESQCSAGSYAAELSQTRKLETQRHYASEKLDTIQLELVAMEVKMGITHRWEPSSPEYQATIKYICTREYHRALDNLQCLVIQRLFELQCLNVAQTAYKMYTQISKNLQTHCHAIQSAVKKYNNAASKLQPPCLPLEWAKVLHYQFLDEFTLLRETRQDIQDKPWAKPAIRETMRQHLRIQRAHEEVVCCNVEIRRIHTAIIDEDRHFSHILKDLDDAGSLLLVAAHDFCQRRRLVNAQVLRCVFQVYALQGFTGIPTHGIRKCAPTTDVIEQEFSQLTVGEEVDEDVEDDFLEDDTRADIGTLVEFISDLPCSQL
ncbi:uncharacterized protein EDB93DRAFT_1241917 [Suillus bovinus]|uniref:uncharacterized protein n=1 Tax=Suillus bovinus TaxID=48563 RepID=UPI001B88480F|nr:uncharacterized protein EDB93DRAFT_1241917 [Suillus bovinus]KAG2140271.1 hypothetical protein EDB93DRAFT_1241917 [Suillus bovinus]